MSTILSSLTLIGLTLLAPARPVEPQHTFQPQRIGFVWLNFPTTNGTDVYDNRSSSTQQTHFDPEIAP